MAMPTDKRLVGRRIRIARRAADLDQTDVARAMQVDPVTVSRWETGRTRPALEDLWRLAGVLEKPAAHLAFGDEPWPKALPPDLVLPSAGPAARARKSAG